MAQSPAFVLSSAVGLEIDDAHLSIRHDGDVVLEQTLGREIGVIEAAGDVTIRLPRITGTIKAGGKVTLEGEIDAVSIQGSHVVLGGESVSCKALSASSRIDIGPARLQVDAILAPHIELDPNASGRVKVIQSDNERPANKIKGGFSLADYEDMFGDSEQFLADLGLEAPSSSGAPPEDLDDDLAGVELTPQAPVSRPDDTEEVDDPLSLSLDDLEPIGEERNEADETMGRLQEALERITACYEGGDVPPAVSELRSLVEDGDLDALKTNITSVWNGLLGFHQKRGIRPHHQVTHAFNVIHSLVS